MKRGALPQVGNRRQLVAKTLQFAGDRLKVARSIKVVHFDAEVSNARHVSGRDLLDEGILAALAITLDQVNLVAAALVE
ncbi:MAG: hypothetical protein WCD40_07455, partial [Candidatus Acidiferrales bacterium]